MKKLVFIIYIIYGDYRYEKEIFIYYRRELSDWFRTYVREESTTMSAVLNQYVLSLKRGTEKPKRLLY